MSLEEKEYLLNLFRKEIVRYPSEFFEFCHIDAVQFVKNLRVFSLPLHTIGVTLESKGGPVAVRFGLYENVSGKFTKATPKNFSMACHHELYHVADICDEDENNV